MFQVDGDMEDLNDLFSDEASHSDLSDETVHLGKGHCSALIRLLKGGSDLYVAQDTWSDLSSMLRILKKYSFDFHELAWRKSK